MLVVIVVVNATITTMADIKSTTRSRGIVTALKSVRHRVQGTVYGEIRGAKSYVQGGCPEQ